MLSAVICGLPICLPLSLAVAKPLLFSHLLSNYLKSLPSLEKSPHVVGSENTILSGSDTKLFHFCTVEQNALATFVNSSKQRRLLMDCTGSVFAVYCR